MFFYKTNEFSGKLKSSSEGNVFWIKSEELNNYNLASDFDEMFEIFKDDNLQEFQWKREKGLSLIHIFYNFFNHFKSP